MVEEASTLRRSTRIRKPISYKEIEEAKLPISPSPEPSNAPTTTAASSNVSPSEPSSESDEDEEDFSDEEKSVKRGRGRQPTGYKPPTKKPRSEGLSGPWKLASTGFHTSRDTKLESMSGTDETMREIYVQRLQCWRDVFSEIPEGLLDYTAGWGICEGDWNGKGGERQKTEPIAKEDAEKYTEAKTINLFHGPPSSQKHITLQPFHTKPPSASYKQGYLTNISQPVWALDFLPQPPSSGRSQLQYVAISGHASFETQTRLYSKEPGTNVIQIWVLDTSKSKQNCYLSTVICHDWGSCWELKFCPYGAYGEGRAGLLAGAFNDGNVHVIDVREEWLGSNETVYVKISEAGWEYSFGEEYSTTCMAWRSYTELLVGGSNGFVALYDLSDTSEDRTIPSFYTFAVDAYILSITSLAPLHPNLIAVASFDGSIQFLDLRTPYSNTTLSHRQRTFASFVGSFPLWGGIISPEDTCGVHFCALRPTKRGLLLTAHDSAVWDAAASVGGRGAGVHPFVITGGSDGICNLVNSTNRIFIGKRASRKVLFKLEKVEGGIKILEDFELEPQNLENVHSTKVFPDEIGVTRVAWCMNKGYTSWYAAGTASGLLRIENVNAQKGKGRK